MNINNLNARTRLLFLYIARLSLLCGGIKTIKVMKVEIRFNQGVIAGYEVRDLLEIFPELENNFERRKQYDEYYFEKSEVELDIDKLEQLSNKFRFEISGDDLKIIL